MAVSMPSRAWVVTWNVWLFWRSVQKSFNALMGLSCYSRQGVLSTGLQCFNALMGLSCYWTPSDSLYLFVRFQCPHGLELLRVRTIWYHAYCRVSMPSWAWVVTIAEHSTPLQSVFQCPHGLELLPGSPSSATSLFVFQCPHGLELLRFVHHLLLAIFLFQCPHGLELLRSGREQLGKLFLFQCPHGLELLHLLCGWMEDGILRFNALMGLSCYGKNVQYFKFFMILFMHPCYL